MSCKTEGEGDDAGGKEVSFLEWNDQSTDRSLRKKHGVFRLLYKILC